MKFGQVIFTALAGLTSVSATPLPEKYESNAGLLQTVSNVVNSLVATDSGDKPQGSDVKNLLTQAEGLLSEDDDKTASPNAAKPNPAKDLIPELAEALGIKINAGGKNIVLTSTPSD